MLFRNYIFFKTLPCVFLDFPVAQQFDGSGEIKTASDSHGPVKVKWKSRHHEESGLNQCFFRADRINFLEAIGCEPRRVHCLMPRLVRAE